jgi:glutaredoxin-like YruB-family protein
MEVKIYTTPTCGYCHIAKKYLSGRGINFVEHDVSRDRAAAEEMVGLSGQMGVPVIVINGHVILGFDHNRIEKLLEDDHSRGVHFGIKVADASKVASRYGSVAVSGAVLGSVAPASAGARAGLRAGDVIIGINGMDVRDAENLQKALGGLSAGDYIRLAFQRGNETNQLMVKL